MHPLTVPTKTELALIRAAGHETELRINAAASKRGVQTMSVLIGVAGLVFAYDAVSLLVPHWALAIPV